MFGFFLVVDRTISRYYFDSSEFSFLFIRRFSLEFFSFVSLRFLICSLFFLASPITSSGFTFALFAAFLGFYFFFYTVSYHKLGVPSFFLFCTISGVVSKFFIFLHFQFPLCVFASSLQFTIPFVKLAMCIPASILPWWAIFIPNFSPFVYILAFCHFYRNGYFLTVFFKPPKVQAMFRNPV